MQPSYPRKENEHEPDNIEHDGADQREKKAEPVPPNRTRTRLELGAYHGVVFPHRHTARAARRGADLAWRGCRLLLVYHQFSGRGPCRRHHHADRWLGQVRTQTLVVPLAIKRKAPIPCPKPAYFLV